MRRKLLSFMVGSVIGLSVLPFVSQARATEPVFVDAIEVDPLVMNDVITSDIVPTLRSEEDIIRDYDPKPLQELIGTCYITGYTPSAEENGGYAGLDHKGRALKPWQTVAVKHGWLPDGTKLKIEGLPGVFVVSDCGLRDTMHIDVCVNTKKEAYAITGNRKVWILR